MGEAHFPAVQDVRLPKLEDLIDITWTPVLSSTGPQTFEVLWKFQLRANLKDMAGKPIRHGNIENPYTVEGILDSGDAPQFPPLVLQTVLQKLRDKGLIDGDPS